VIRSRSIREQEADRHAVVTIRSSDAWRTDHVTNQTTTEHRAGAPASPHACVPDPVGSPPIYGGRMTQFHRDRRPVLTVQVADHGDERWLIEIEAIAATPVAA
jgi:hypothetical protein